MRKYLVWRSLRPAGADRLNPINTWLVVQPELAEAGYEDSVNNHSKVSTTLWWSGPPHRRSGCPGPATAGWDLKSGS
jgi:hypothetical protein